jgi:hypothetical protein
MEAIDFFFRTVKVKRKELSIFHRSDKRFRVVTGSRQFIAQIWMNPRFYQKKESS